MSDLQQPRPHAPEEVPPAPRSLTPAARKLAAISVRLSWWVYGLVLGALIAGVGAGLLYGAAAMGHVLIDIAGSDTKGVVLQEEVLDSGSAELDFSYEVKGQKRRATSYQELEPVRHLQTGKVAGPGDPVAVEYLSFAPSIARIKHTFLGSSSPWWTVIWTTVLSGLGLVFTFLVLRDDLRTYRAYRHGAAVLATVKNVEKDGDKEHKLEYRYEIGGHKDTHTLSADPDTIARFAAAKTFAVVIEPKRPSWPAVYT